MLKRVGRFLRFYWSIVWKFTERAESATTIVGRVAMIALLVIAYLLPDALKLVDPQAVVPWWEANRVRVMLPTFVLFLLWNAHALYEEKENAVSSALRWRLTCFFSEGNALCKDTHGFRTWYRVGLVNTGPTIDSVSAVMGESNPQTKTSGYKVGRYPDDEATFQVPGDASGQPTCYLNVLLIDSTLPGKKPTQACLCPTFDPRVRSTENWVLAKLEEYKLEFFVLVSHAGSQALKIRCQLEAVDGSEGGSRFLVEDVSKSLIAESKPRG